MLVICLLAVIFGGCFAQEEPITINRPRTRVQQPWVQINTDHVRCFCNLPPCVATGYMCKSSSGGCFSDLLDSSRTSAYRGRHGCIEYLNESQRSRCPISDKDGQIHAQDKVGEKGNQFHAQDPKKMHPRSLLVCCTNDMCNHADNPVTRNLLNNTLGEDSDAKFQHQDQEDFLYSNSEVWFRAATIAVPICGAVILFVLIALAVKILKSENQNSLNQKLGSAMYVVPSEQKQGSRWPDRPYKPCTVKRPCYTQAHPSAFMVREEDPVLRQYQMPLLVASEARDFNVNRSSSTVNRASSTVNESKNDANAKLNLLHCGSDSSRSLILEIGKTPDYSAANINLGSEDKCTKEKKLIS